MTFPAFIITNNIGAILLQMGVPPGAPTLQDGGIGVGGFVRNAGDFTMDDGIGLIN